MTDWNHVIVEGFCMAEVDKPPCGKEVSAFCLGSAVGLCPYFSYTEAEGEREVARHIPVYLILWDRIKFWMGELGWKLKWYFWIKWTWKGFIGSEVTKEDCGGADEVWGSIVKERLNCKRRFRRWFPKALRDEELTKSGLVYSYNTFSCSQEDS